MAKRTRPECDQDYILELETEIVQLKSSVADKVQAGRERLLQMILTFISPLLLAYVGWLQWQTNTKLDENKIDRDRIETKIDVAAEKVAEAKEVAHETRNAVEALKPTPPPQ